jgi:hypothetical protein
MMYEGMDEKGRPIPKVRRASLLASQNTVPLQKSTVPLHTRKRVVRKRVYLTHIPSPHVPLKKRQLPTWVIFMLVGVAFVLLLNSAWAIVSHQSLTSIVFMQQLNQTQSPQQSPMLTASERVSVHRQSNRAEYNNDNPEWQLWSYSACSGCALAALLDAYGAQKNGKPLNCGDVLEVEYNLGVYDPGKSPTQNRGLLPPGQQNLARTAAQFGFASDFSKNLSLDDLINLANSGTPSIVGIPTHVMIITGGDSTYVKLADSGGLHLSIVTRDQFLHGLPGTRLYTGQAWIPGWYFTLKPK